VKACYAPLERDGITSSASNAAIASGLAGSGRWGTSGLGADPRAAAGFRPPLFTRLRSSLCSSANTPGWACHGAELVIAGRPQALTLCCQLRRKRPQWRRQTAGARTPGKPGCRAGTARFGVRIPGLALPLIPPSAPKPPWACAAMPRKAAQPGLGRSLWPTPTTSLFATSEPQRRGDFQLGSHRAGGLGASRSAWTRQGARIAEVTLSDGAVVCGPIGCVIATACAACLCWPELARTNRGSPPQRHANHANRSIWRLPGVARQHI